MRGATDNKLSDTIHKIVSIHAPHAGRDDGAKFLAIGMDVSIHAPHAGRDL